MGESQTEPIKIIEAYGNYQIIIQNKLSGLKNWFHKNTYSKYIVLIDENTAKHCYPVLVETLVDFNLNSIKIQSGEKQKNFDTLHTILEELIHLQADRKALLINLGGGVIGDMGAFAASVYKRGINFIQIPTTLLSMVDASVGGKTGINFKSFKNQIGTFCHPQLVFINTAFLNTLPERHVNNGFAEIIKHHFLSGSLSPVDLLQNPDLFKQNIHAQIEHSVNYKNNIVAQDFKENGPRKQLNFGHTIGHAIESYSIKNDGSNHLYHGEAIASGFIMEAWLSHKKCTLPANQMQQIIDTTQQIFKPYPIHKNQFEPLCNLMMNDKKNDAGEIQFALLAALGKPVWNITVTEAELIETFNWYQQHILNAV